ncbi:MAG: EscU/YscU/HrcU family type III secretion system export apparatus switch protein [Myxococcales bacterium]|nr:EscU/YscU/HrcU family type III secretion system export apparatus switch protein [Myxococcales bacterium]
MSERTEQPTAKRLRDARKKGQLPRSRMLSSSAAAAGGLCGLWAFAPESAARLSRWTVELFARPEASPASALAEGTRVLAALAAPALAGAFAASALAAVACAGFQFNLATLAPKLERIDPAAGLRRLVSARQALDLLKGALVAGILAWAMWASLAGSAQEAFRAVRFEGAAGLLVVVDRLAGALGRCALVALALGAADYALARRRHRKDLMMTREEVKQEHKDAEGDPRHRAARKAMHRQLASGGPARGVQRATCVVVNPTHIAVALRYDEKECDAPYLVAKGREDDALRIRCEARRLGIPIVKDIPLARSLVHYDVGEQIPEELYKAAAAVLKAAVDQRREAETPRG